VPVPTLLRRTAVAAVLDSLGSREVVILANGLISRDGHGHRDAPCHFYMLGSMGLAAAIGLGICLARPPLRVVVLDGDGNLLMGMGVLPMVGAWQPRHFLHVVLDNGVYASTGGQPTVAAAVDFPAVATACGYRRAVSVAAAPALRRRVRSWREGPGPSLIHVRLAAEEPAKAPRVAAPPPEISRRFADAVTERAS
jgi:thiamine pyrophosphate-dependent acetolactate synthase large subunit-like protein